jgi:hypothetical protein
MAGKLKICREPLLGAFFCEKDPVRGSFRLIYWRISRAVRKTLPSGGAEVENGNKNGNHHQVSDWGWRVLAHLQRIELGDSMDEGVPLTDRNLARGAGELVALGLARIITRGKKLAVPAHKRHRHSPSRTRQLRRPEDPAFAFATGPKPCKDDPMD